MARFNTVEIILVNLKLSAVPFLILLSSCLGERYRWVPNAGVIYNPQTRDYTYAMGASLVPGLELSPRTEDTFRQQPAGTTVKLEQKEKKGAIGEFHDILKEGKDADGNWTPWGAVVIIAVLLFWREISHKKKK